MRTRASSAAERLVEEEDFRLDCQSTCQRHALPLAARELRRVAIGQTLQLHELEQLVDAGADLVLRSLLRSSMPKATLSRTVMRLNECVVLEDEADPTLLGWQGGRVRLGNRHLARVGLLEARDDAE